MYLYSMWRLDHWTLHLYSVEQNATKIRMHRHRSTLSNKFKYSMTQNKCMVSSPLKIIELCCFLDNEASKCQRSPDTSFRKSSEFCWQYSRIPIQTAQGQVSWPRPATMPPILCTPLTYKAWDLFQFVEDQSSQQHQEESRTATSG
jgi:hypothetical protein